MKRFICFFLLFAVLLCPAASAEPLRDGDISISAPSAILMEKYTGEMLYEKNAHERIFPASVTKVMTLLLVMEALEDGRIGWDDMVTTSAAAAGKGDILAFAREAVNGPKIEHLSLCVIDGKERLPDTWYDDNFEECEAV